MKHFSRIVRHAMALQITICFLLCFASTVAYGADKLDGLLSRASRRVAGSLERFSEVRCTEKVEQQKLAEDGKVERVVGSTYDYLVIFTDAGGDLTLNESRLPMGQAKSDKRNTPLLVTNGFATMFLVFHPQYAASFQFTDLGDETIGPQRLEKIGFRYLRGTRSPAVLALRGREYPLPLSGTAWIDPETGNIERISADIGSSLEDVGITMIRSDVDYAPVLSPERKQAYWFPERASVEVETPRQHWRNTHLFNGYQWFSVGTEEKVSSK